MPTLARHAAKNMDADQCSTGGQKALLLGLTLAQERALACDPGAGPSLILIDEAAAHLDAVRRAALFDETLGKLGSRAPMKVCSRRSGNARRCSRCAMGWCEGKREGKRGGRVSV